MRFKKIINRLMLIVPTMFLVLAFSLLFCNEYSVKAEQYQYGSISGSTHTVSVSDGTLANFTVGLAGSQISELIVMRDIGVYYPGGVNPGSRPNLIPASGMDNTDGGTAPMTRPVIIDVPGVSDAMSFWSTMWGFSTDNIGWVFLAMLLVIFCFWFFGWHLEHVGYAMITASIVIGFFSIPTINVIPWGGLFIAVLGLIAGTVIEVKA